MDADGKLNPETVAWIQEEANLHYGGDWGRCAAAKLEALHAASKSPDLWAGPMAEVRRRPKK
jgi:hypothetical protein